MNLFKWFHDRSEQRNSRLRYSQGLDQLEEARKHLVAKPSRYQEALTCLDQVIASGIETAEVFGMRGTCLQALDFHLDAIEDYSKAISLDVGDCNTYFQRSVSTCKNPK